MTLAYHLVSFADHQVMLPLSLTSTDSWAHFSPFLVLAPFHLQLQTLYLRHLFWTSTHSL